MFPMQMNEKSPQRDVRCGDFGFFPIGLFSEEYGDGLYAQLCSVGSAVGQRHAIRAKINPLGIATCVGNGI